MKKNQAVLLMNQESFIDEFQKMLLEQILEQ